jgi:hypothetical protein
MRHFLHFFLLLFSVALQAQAPVNDDCTGLINLGEIPYCSTPAQYTNVDATASNIDPVFNIPTCFTSGDVQRDVWFQFTVPADGSIVDVTVQVLGNIDGNGTLENPQVAVYRGDCELGGLNELACASAPNGTNEISLDLFGLTPGLNYFLRINDYSATATPNSGTFKLCVEEYVATFNIGDASGSSSCTGTLYDSGGPNDDYTFGEAAFFTICPTEFHQCIILNVVNYETEGGFDFLSLFAGEDNTGIEIISLDGTGDNLEFQIPTNCATIGFSSDGSVQDAGFELTWSCSPNPCTIPPFVTCDEPEVINDLPYTLTDANNCTSGNSISTSSCGDSHLAGNDYVFTYTSPGNECIKVDVLSNFNGTGIGVYSACPDEPGAVCITINEADFQEEPTIDVAFLTAPGTYTIVYSSEDCGVFSISIDTITCPVVLPPASTCDQALNIGGCSSDIPQIIALNPGSGDPDFIQEGVNDGCFLNPQLNYSFFYFRAGADGEFHFAVEAANPLEASDIDFSVWGPIDDVEDICLITSTTQPVRSSWAGGADLTGLSDIHPETNIQVIDEYDCDGIGIGNNDDFVSPLDVVEGKIYVVFLDDFGQAIENDGIAINFNGTSPGVLSESYSTSVSNDTVVCGGGSAQLLATGGVGYSWFPTTGLSCNTCPNPIATPTETTNYQVSILNACEQVTENVVVSVPVIDLGPDVTICSNATFQLNENAIPNFGTYEWIGEGLSCADCPSPIVSGLGFGLYLFVGTLTTPECTLTDAVWINVLAPSQPQYQISDDQNICAGTTIQLGGATQPGVTYAWTSVPAGFTSTESNPTVTPTADIKYFLSATNGECPVPAIDSVVVDVNTIPVIAVTGDTTTCTGSAVNLTNFIPEDDVTYNWVPNVGSLPDPTNYLQEVAPTTTTTYTLTASNGTCESTATVTVTAVQLILQLNVPDTVRICQGQTVDIEANINPNSTPLIWTPTTYLNLSPNNQSAIATPIESILYTVSASLPGCQRVETVFVAVDSIPDNLDISPADTTICEGAQVLLRSKIYEPAEYEFMDFSWTPGTGQLTPDSLFNLLVQPEMTTVYRRISRNGGCVDTAFALVNVIKPPQMEIVPADTTVCPGSVVQLTLLATDVEDIVWTPTSGLSCTTCNTPAATVQTTTTYTASGTYQSCPVSTSATINTEPAPPLNIPTDLQLCGGQSILLNNVPANNGTYTWSSNDPNLTIPNTANPTVIPTQNTTFTVVATNGCIAQSTFDVTVYNGTLSVSNDTSICKNRTATLTALGNLQGTFTWTPGDDAQVITVSPEVTTTYNLVYSFGDGCTLTDQVIFVREAVLH